jgi:hypothetical protein
LARSSLPTQATRLIWHEIEDAVGDDHIGPVIRNRQCLAVACSKRDIGQTSCKCITLGFTQHLGGHIDTDDLPRWPNHFGGYQTIDTGAGANIYHTFIGVQRTEAEGVARASEGLNGTLWYTDQPGFLIAEQSREVATGMEMEPFCGMGSGRWSNGSVCDRCIVAQNALHTQIITSHCWRISIV